MEINSKLREFLRPPAFQKAGGVRYVERIGDFNSVPFPAPLKTARVSAAQRRGQLWEARIRSKLHDGFGGAACFNPRFRFVDGGGATRICEPDVIVRFPDVVAVLEVKTIHTARAFYQLAELYEPVCAAFFGKPAVLIEVCGSFDPSVGFPCKVDLLMGLDLLVKELPGLSPDLFYVCKTGAKL